MNKRNKFHCILILKELLKVSNKKMEVGLYTRIPACEFVSTTHIPRGPKIETETINLEGKRDHLIQPSPITDEETKSQGSHVTWVTSHNRSSARSPDFWGLISFNYITQSCNMQAPFHQKMINEFNISLVDFVNLSVF